MATIMPFLLTAEEDRELSLAEMARELDIPLSALKRVYGDGLAGVTDDLVATLYDKAMDIERDFMVAAARQLRKPDLAGLWARNGIQAENELRAALDKAVSQNLTKTTYKAVNESYNEAIMRALAPHETIYEKALDEGLVILRPESLAESDMVRITVAQGYKDTWDVMDRVVLTGKEDVARRLREAVTDITVGGDSPDHAIREAMADMAEEGITGHVYPNGRKIAMSPYARREITNGASRICREINLERAAEWGTDLIQVTAHAGARPLCFPYQGHVFSISGSHGRHMALADTSYGEPAGLFGINCRHWFWPFFEGLNTEYSAGERDPASMAGGPPNAEIYEATQVQRYNERQIRKWKLRETAHEAFDPDSRETAHARGKVREWQKRNRDFIKAMNDRRIDIRRDYAREKAA
jgi:hypothetical protein